ncbi:helix-turn-helix domain-containing protein [uncultured Megasphaera sp.]|uniref:helix-turn-helix domain-containing protein n=1 Tax=uncultured Megasphaera sp. TaxID=165188 RepID=UPI002596AB63|nr:helix-turn-helix transcriptional regulator [uncultured Megasphaera sp.]
MYIGELIKKYRLNHSISMQEFANASGLSKAYIGMLEKIYNPQNQKPISPSLPKMQSIAKAMGLTIDELLPLLDDEQEVIINTSNKPEKEGVKMHPKSEANEETELNTRDEREIESDLEDMMNSVSSAAFEGEDDIEDIEAFKATIKAAMIQAKKIAKKKYTPKKYRRD